MSVQIETSVPPCPDWMTWLNNGEQYYKAACPAGKHSRFLPDLQYNLLSMSLEGYVMAIAGFHDCLPYNHTYTDLMDSLESHVQVDPELKRRILNLERIQNLCSVDDYYRYVPTETDLDDLRNAVAWIGDLARQTCM